MIKFELYSPVTGDIKKDELIELINSNQMSSRYINIIYRMKSDLKTDVFTSFLKILVAPEINTIEETDDEKYFIKIVHGYEASLKSIANKDTVLSLSRVNSDIYNLDFISSDLVDKNNVELWFLTEDEYVDNINFLSRNLMTERAEVRSL